MNLCINIPAELKQFLISTYNNSEIEEKIKWISTNNEISTLMYTTEYYSQSGELLKVDNYTNGTKEEIYYNNGKVITEDKFNADKIYEIKSFDKNRKLLHDTKYIRLNGLIISIVRYENGNEYKISYSYDEIKRIINRTIYINQECITKQIYSYDSQNRVANYRDEYKTINITDRIIDNTPACYKLSDKYGNQICVTNNFDGITYENTDIVLNDNSAKIHNLYYCDNFILKTPYATEEDFNGTLLYINQWLETKYETEPNNILQFENKNRILPITMRKHIPAI